MSFPVFPTFSSNKRWWWLRAFSFLGRRTRESRVALTPNGRLRQLATPLGSVFRELGQSMSVLSLPWLLLCSFFLSFSLCSCIYKLYDAFSVFLKCMHEINIYSFDAHKHQHYLHTRWVEKGPYTRVHGNIRSRGESVVMLGLRLAW